MFKEQRLRKQFIDENIDGLGRPIRKGQIRKEEIEAYQQEIERFQELLLIFIHLTGRQPALSEYDVPWSVGRRHQGLCGLHNNTGPHPTSDHILADIS
jgi:hypothetical protein